MECGGNFYSEVECEGDDVVECGGNFYCEVECGGNFYCEVECGGNFYCEVECGGDLHSCYNQSLMPKMSSFGEAPSCDKIHLENCHIYI